MFYLPVNHFTFLTAEILRLLPLPAFMLKGLCVSKMKLDVYEENYLQTFSHCKWPLAETNFLDLFSQTVT